MFTKKLEALGVQCLSTIATNIKEERCYVNNAGDFLEKTKMYTMRFLFRELKKENQNDILKWMRANLPTGSTGMCSVLEYMHGLIMHRL